MVDDDVFEKSRVQLFVTEEGVRYSFTKSGFTKTYHSTEGDGGLVTEDCTKEEAQEVLSTSKFWWCIPTKCAKAGLVVPSFLTSEEF